MDELGTTSLHDLIARFQADDNSAVDSLIRRSELASSSDTSMRSPAGLPRNALVSWTNMGLALGGPRVG